MAKSIESLVAFNAGELAPTLTSRVDQAKYRAACLKLRNMICLKTGPATRRPGLEYIAPTKYATTSTTLVARMEPFVFSADTSFMLEFGNHYVRFYSNGAQVNVTSAQVWASGVGVYRRNDYVTYSGVFYRCLADITGSSTIPPSDTTHWIQQSILELWTPYTADASGGDQRLTEVFQIQCAQLNDVVYIVHKDHPRWVLTRLSDEHWTMKEVVEMVPPLLDQNATNVTIASSATAGTTSLTCSAPEWDTGVFYEVGDVVNVSPLTFYKCLFPHISGATFLDDAELGYWEVFTVFQAGHVGSYWELANLRPSASVEYTGTAAGGFANGASASITVFGDWEVRTYGIWAANIEVQGSVDGGDTWRKLRVITGRNDRNADIKGKASPAMLMRVVVTNASAPTVPGATDPRIVLEAVDGFLFGIVKITQVFTAYAATAEVITQLPVANSWVSGQAYFIGDRVGYNGVNYICLIDVTSATAPPSDTTNWLADGWPTPYWSEGAWSDLRGYPRAIAAFQQKVYCAFTRFQPLRVWGTQTGDIENWDLGDQSLATDGLAFDIDATGDGNGVWLAAQDALFAGFELAEWVIQGSDATGAIGPTSVTAHRQSRWGSNANVAARCVGDALIFADRQGFALRQMLFSIYTSKYMSQDLTLLNDIILNDGAVQLAYQRLAQKNGILWAATMNGELVGMTYELDQEVFGWHRHVTGDRNTEPATVATDDKDMIESVAVIPGQGSDDDEVWCVVSRTINGQPATRYVERINPVNWYRQPDYASKLNPGYPANKNQAFLVDCGVTVVDPATNVFTGLDHLEGNEVVVCINAVDYGRFTVTGGQITVDTFEAPGPANTFAHIGLPFTSTVQPMNLDADPRMGDTKGLTKKVTKIVPSFYDTLACKFSNGGTAPGSVREIVFTDTEDPFAAAPLFTGDKEIRDFPGDYGLQVPIILYTDGPLPMSVLSLVVGYSLSGTP